MYTIKKLATLAGISVRTLHYYDAIGLLKPAQVGSNGYRQYNEPDLLRLQQILFYRQLDLGLEQIKSIITQPDFDIPSALRSHQIALQRQVDRIGILMNTIERTISILKGKEKMSAEGLFEGFSEEEQEKYALEAEKLYDPNTVKESNRRWKAYPQEEKDRILAEGKTIYKEMVSVIPQGAGSLVVQKLVARWHKHMEYFWIPTDEQLLGLANGYNTDPRFKANFDKMHPDLAKFMLEAVKIYVSERKKMRA